ncbi:MAG: hypothetical protein BMS9Abin31_0258 [Gammaproteobacteria bacterium]|nr:MAG: hypothetical protein BMS9Abin31_0258 [Gammaproteobacteria bacterium]
MNKHLEHIKYAEGVLNQYGNVLSTIDHASYGVADSLLPFSKEQIMEAIQVLLLELGDGQESAQDGLIQGYVILAQFIPDEQVAILNSVHSVFDVDGIGQQSCTIAEDAGKIITSIKLEMEQLLNEIQLFLSKKT